VSDQEHLNSENLDLQSNTWHNLTYAYQGEGGSRVTYLDGRKVAEDQAEDTFGEYPPFAMTGYSQGGYVVSASSEFKVDHIDLMPQDTYGLERMPQTAIIAGSDDNVNWTLIKSITTDDHALTKYTPYIVNATRAYKYIRFIWNTLTTAGGNAVYMGRIAGQEMRFYGHRENDLVRLPDPTRVLKYPHIAMTTETTTVQGPQINPGMPGDRGYEIIYSNHGGSPQLPSRAFDGKKNSTTNPKNSNSTAQKRPPQSPSRSVAGTSTAWPILGSTTSLWGGPSPRDLGRPKGHLPWSEKLHDPPQRSPRDRDHGT
jgi:hypothetical protein